jgi:hypothetical protein
VLLREIRERNYDGDGPLGSGSCRDAPVNGRPAARSWQVRTGAHGSGEVSVKRLLKNVEIDDDGLHVIPVKTGIPIRVDEYAPLAKWPDWSIDAFFALTQ